MADILDQSNEQDDISWNMSKETLKRINAYLILMGGHRYNGQLNEWRNACESLCNEISPFFSKLKENEIADLNKLILNLNEVQKVYNNLRSIGEGSGMINAKFMASLTNYDRKLRLFADKFGLYIAKGQDARFAMKRQYGI